MRFDYAGLAIAAWLAIPLATARAQPAASLMAQNTYSGNAVPGDDSILPPGPDPYIATNALAAARQEVEAAETNLNISAGVMHTQYHENATPGSGDDENGFTGGGGVGASVLLPERGLFDGADFYSAIAFNLSAGNLNYGGHYLASGLPLQATERAVFMRLEARLGIGFQMIGGAELIPFIAGGYQSWNRNIDVQGHLGTDEDYDSALLGGGVKLDYPVTSRLVLSGTAEALALVAGNVSFNGVNINHGLGGSAEERIELGADYDVNGPFHVFATADWQHFNYAGNKPTLSTYSTSCPSSPACEYYEPLSTTTQFGVNIGAAYSF